jgi:hypothetical protein
MVDRIDTPSDFYKHVVQQDINELRTKPDALCLVYHACISLLSLRDWVVYKYKNTPWTSRSVMQPPFISNGDMQNRLEGLHDEFRIIYEVANLSKHLHLDRKRTQADGIANVEIKSITTFTGGAMPGGYMFNTAMLNEPAQASTRNSVFINDGGKLYDVPMSVEATNAIWSELFAENTW